MEQQSAAASVVQARYRKHIKSRTSRGVNLSKPKPNDDDSQQDEKPDSPERMKSDDRWTEMMSEGTMREHNRDQIEGKNDTKSRWERGVFYSSRIGHSGTKDDDASNQDETEGHGGTNKEMDAAYWLELVDSKHRYGSSLRIYHKYWNEQSGSSDNFFHWLDEGEGRFLDLPERSRERLDSERITYLSAEQRKNYLVKITRDGKLTWKRNGRPVDTTKGKWKDLGEGRGIGPRDDESGSDTSSLTSSGSENQDVREDKEKEYERKHYGGDRADGDLGKIAQLKTKLSITPAAISEHLLRKTTKKNIWIFVSDMSGNLYVGIKETGGFQHSSFLYGAKVRSAGLLKVKNGQLRSLKPLSGHYKSGTSQFKRFVEDLKKQGVDLSRVSISKSLVTIGALEHYGKATSRLGKLESGIKDLLHLNGKEKDDEDDANFSQCAEEENRLQNDSTPESNDNEAKQKENVPYSGKKLEEMSYEQRVEKGAAIMRNVMHSGKGRKGKTEAKETAKETV